MYLQLYPSGLQGGNHRKLDISDAQVDLFPKVHYQIIPSALLL